MFVAVPDTTRVMEPRARFEHLYRAHAGAVRSYARRRIDAPAADDVVADVFLVAWRRLADVPERDPLPWLLAVARRTLANHRRSTARQGALHRRLRSTAPAPIDHPPWVSDADEAVIRALARIGDDDRETLLLVAWEGLIPTQAATVVGVTANTFSARLTRARRRFEQALSSERAAVSHVTHETNAEASR